jgi:nucleoside-diphosphate-sugar epimerase
MANYLVTGGAGFIGSHVTAALVARGDAVRVLDNLATGFRDNLRAVPAAVLVEGDVRHYDTVRKAVAGVDYVIHLAALPSVPRSIRDPITTNDVNVGGTLNVLHASRDANVRRVSFASSSSVYGRGAGLPKREEMSTAPLSPYAVSKLTGEHYCRTFWELHGLETVALRLFNVFGPRQDPHSPYSAVIPLFITKLLRGEAPSVNGDGSQTRDFTYVDNVVGAFLSACAAPAPAAAGRAFNIAGGVPHSLNDLLEELRALLSCDLTPDFLAPRAGDVPHSYASIEAARAGLGYVPSVDFAEGLRLTVESMRPVLTIERATRVKRPVVTVGPSRVQAAL